MGDTPSVSSAFRTGSDPRELREAAIDLARALDYARSVDKVHWEKIKELDGENKRLETATKEMSRQIVELLRRMDKIEARMAIYAALGAAFGGGMVTIIIKVIFK